MFLEATLTFHGVSNFSPFATLRSRFHPKPLNPIDVSSNKQTNKQTQKHSLSFPLQHLKGF